MPGTRDDPVDETWFEDLFGFQELSFQGMQERFSCSGSLLVLNESPDAKKTFEVGSFETLTLAKLRARFAATGTKDGDQGDVPGGLTFQNIVAHTIALHRDADNAGAVMQVASLFNCLETTDFYKRDDGITRYGREGTQGAACALACPYATIFRNYFPEVVCDGGINCLSAAGALLRNEEEGFWTMRRGHCLPRAGRSIERLSSMLLSEPDLADKLQSHVQVGVHWNAAVAHTQHFVCQVFAAALPVGLVKTVKASDWAPFARAVLKSVYCSTLTVGSILAAQRRQRVKVFLTLVGGGMLGNRLGWIHEAIEAALVMHEKSPLDVRLVHYAAVPAGSFFRNLEAGRAAPHVAAPVHAKAAVPLPMNGGLGMTQELQKLGLERPCTRTMQKIRKAFQNFDTNGDGVIDRREFTTLLQRIDKNFFTRGVIDCLITCADADGDGVVHYVEFVSWLSNEDEDLLKRFLEEPEDK